MFVTVNPQLLVAHASLGALLQIWYYEPEFYKFTTLGFSIVDLGVSLCFNFGLKAPTSGSFELSCL